MNCGNSLRLVAVLLAGSFSQCETTPSTTDGSALDLGTDLSPQADLGSPIRLPTPGCPPPLQAVDTSLPTAVVGTGTSSSCTEGALVAALTAGGIVTFSCGPGPVTLAVSAELVVTKDTVLDGGGKVTLSGGGKTRILKLASTVAQSTPQLTVQNLRFADGWVDGTLPAGDTTLGGAAIYRLGGSLRVINSQFVNNHGADSSPDAAGGAIFAAGSGPTVIVGSTFSNNSCSSGGALGSLGSPLQVFNSTIDTNRATGSSGNGGGIAVNGTGNEVSLCGVVLSNNQGQMLGGGLFRKGAGKEPVTIDRSIIFSNSLPPADTSAGGGIWVQSGVATISNTSVVRNVAAGAGGLAFGPGAAILLTNLTVSGNTAASGLGGGMALDSSVTGKIWNCTFADNRAPALGAYGGALAGGGSGLTLQNSIITDSIVGSGTAPISCTQKLTAAGANLQWPVTRAGGGSDDPIALCADGVLTQSSPALWPLSDYGAIWPNLTQPPYCNTVVQNKGVGCPATDQLGTKRNEPCALGAVEICLVD